ncbi:cell division topological specificity factor [Wigglesworthia glossinidia endosymbiont of Glossina morsitans morsitans (Yale colony)]|uniref:Cell division topological specificity factor n=1 Tax=Wigglesworthia glossinidia endosymbiont of Glossina morsitans morsitans (Yale colony) TaxID=1142511 RepID=H6Q4U2_WIGGL|nr:cell division topological specificity factor MinE [Wigglesworthia glossinidia]AFA41225.1 cell division topological specificity factor [Wigglesworthia glossinidia endosymbiont of Glossina morsitans morsitans (Yale colony)]
MVLLNFFISRKKMTAHTAKKRLKIIIEEQRKNAIKPVYVQLKKDLKRVIGKYFNINPNTLSIKLEHKNHKDLQIFELNIILPKEHKTTNVVSE